MSINQTKKIHSNNSNSNNQLVARKRRKLRPSAMEVSRTKTLLNHLKKRKSLTKRKEAKRGKKEVKRVKKKLQKILRKSLVKRRKR